jgi:hypothetical protein
MECSRIYVSKCFSNTSKSIEHVTLESQTSWIIGLDKITPIFKIWPARHVAKDSSILRQNDSLGDVIFQEFGIYLKFLLPRTMATDPRSEAIHDQEAP